MKILSINIADGETEPITLQQAKDFARVTSEDEDSLIEDLITVAREKIERFTSLSLIDKEIVLTVETNGDSFPLPYPDLDEISEVKYLRGQNTDGSNDWETLEADEWRLIGTQFAPKYGGVHEITYTTTARTDKSLLFDLKRVLVWLWTNRGDTDMELPAELLSNCKHLKSYSWV